MLMRTPRTQLPFAPLLVLAIASALAVAQEPQAPVKPAPAQKPPAATPPANAEAGPGPGGDAEAGPRRPRRQAMVLEAGTVHPVAGPAIADGVVVIRGERIVAVGKKGEVEIPEGATVRSFPGGHLYPGLIDAQTDAFTDDGLRGDGSLDAGAAFADDLHVRGDREDALVEAGITTAYVTVRSPSQLRGQGAIVRPKAGGFELWTGKEHAGVELRMTNGLGPTHALQRQQQLDGLANTFDGLEDHRKAKSDHAEALKKYEKEYADYVAFFQKKKDAEKPKDGDGEKGDKGKDGEKPKDGDKNAPPTAPGTQPGGEPAPGERRRGPGGRRPGGPTGPGGGGPGDPKPNGGPTGPGGGDDDEVLLTALVDLLAVPQDPPKQEPGKPAPTPQPAGEKAPQAPEKQAPEKQGAEKKDDKKEEPPKRPTYPKAPGKDPQKDALLRVIDGEVPLRVEAHRADELRAALKLQQKAQVPVLVLEQAYGAAPLAGELAAQGVSVVLTEVLPNSLPEQYDAYDPTALPQQLQQAGVPFAIATGSARRAGILPLMAAAAVARGLDRDAALRAITLSAAEILGVAKDTGSLQAGKFADVLVTDRPLFASDCRVLFVASKGHPEYEAK